MKTPAVARAFLPLLCAVVAVGLGAQGCDEAAECPSGDEMVQLQANDFALEIDKYEASRADTLGCSIAGDTPWTSVSYAQAATGCESVGKRLCTLEEWQRACRSVALSYGYPYGPAFEAGRCNGQAGGQGGVAPAGSFPGCTTVQEVFDLSGNVREWVEGPDGPVLAGGGFSSSESDLRCDQYISPPGGAQAYQAGVADGFRCCR